MCGHGCGRHIAIQPAGWGMPGRGGATAPAEAMAEQQPTHACGSLLASAALAGGVAGAEDLPGTVWRCGRS